MKEMLFSLAFILCSTGIQSVHPMVLAGIRCDWRRSSESNFSKGAAPCRPATPDRGGMRHIWICGRPGRRAIGNAKAAIGQWACSMSTRIRWACIAEWYRGASLGRGAAQAPSKGAVRAAAPVVGGSGQAASDAVLAKPSLDTRPMRNSVTSGNQLMVVPIAECLGNQVLREAQPCWGGAHIRQPCAADAGHGGCGACGYAGRCIAGDGCGRNCAGNVTRGLPACRACQLLRRACALAYTPALIATVRTMADRPGRRQRMMLVEMEWPMVRSLLASPGSASHKQRHLGAASRMPMRSSRQLSYDAGGNPVCWAALCAMWVLQGRYTQGDAAACGSGADCLFNSSNPAINVSALSPALRTTCTSLGSNVEGSRVARCMSCSASALLSASLMRWLPRSCS